MQNFFCPQCVYMRIFVNITLTNISGMDILYHDQHLTCMILCKLCLFIDTVVVYLAVFYLLCLLAATITCRVKIMPSKQISVCIINIIIAYTVKLNEWH